MTTQSSPWGKTSTLTETLQPNSMARLNSKTISFSDQLSWDRRVEPSNLFARKWTRLSWRRIKLRSRQNMSVSSARDKTSSTRALLPSLRRHANGLSLTSTTTSWQARLLTLTPSSNKRLLSATKTFGLRWKTSGTQLNTQRLTSSRRANSSLQRTWRWCARWLVSSTLQALSNRPKYRRLSFQKYQTLLLSNSAKISTWLILSEECKNSNLKPMKSWLDLGNLCKLSKLPKKRPSLKRPSQQKPRLSKSSSEAWL